MADVVSLRGDIPEDSDLKNEILIEMLEDLLDKAKKGEVVALGYFGVKPNKSVFTGWDGCSRGYFHQLEAGVRIVEYRMLRMNVPLERE